MTETKNYVIRFNKDQTFSPKTLPSLSSPHTPILRSLSPSIRTKEGFSGHLDHFPSLSKLNTPKVNHFGRFLSESKVSSINPSRVIENSCGKVKIIAANTNPGFLNKRNEDRVKIILNLKKPVLFSEDLWPKSSFYGLYDGHDGKFSAEFLRENLHDFILLDKNFPFRLKEAVFEGFRNTERKLLESSEEQTDFSGASAVVFIVVGNKCVAGNLGDAVAVLSVDEGRKVVNLSKEHKTFDESEVKRIEEKGGSLFSEYFIDDKGFKCEKGPLRINPGGLSVTRCFGSPQAKMKKFGGIKGMILDQPYVRGFKVKENFDFVLLASSGFFDKMNCEEVVEKVWNGIRLCENDASLEQKLDAGVRKLLKDALKNRCENNLTVILIGFKNLVQALNEKLY
jgi:protein phosphatase 2C family protein 2/3